MVKKNIPFVPKARPIEDFRGNLNRIVCAKGWRAKNLDQLKIKIGSVIV